MTATPSFAIGDKIIATSRLRDATGKPIVNSVQGVVEKSEDGELVLVTEQGYRFALSGWTEYRKASAKK